MFVNTREEMSWEKFADLLATASKPTEPPQRFKDDQRWLLDHLNEHMIFVVRKWNSLNCRVVSQISLQGKPTRSEKQVESEKVQT
jgi:hypothetical protein